MDPAELVLRQFPNRVAISVKDAGVALGMAPKTALNRMYAGTFPVRIHRIGEIATVHLHDLITYLETGLAANDAEPPKPKKKGRPTKADALRKAGLI